ncbi:TPA: hypothetical protein EYP37_08815 [Candidatus Poribacteria bacterium]|nr:hypothetical protein [Candidatus Poribacteria bacterium]
MSIEELIASEVRLRKLVEDARKKAEKIVADAREEARALIAKARHGKESVEEFLAKEEDKAKKEVKSVIEMYKKEAEKIKRVPKSRFDGVVNSVLREVLGS